MRVVALNDPSNGQNRRGHHRCDARRVIVRSRSMPMMAHWFRFPRQPDPHALRSGLRAEVGARRASEHNVESSWAPEPASEAGVLELLSMDGVALVYAAKLCLALGGEPLRGPWTPPPWALRPWLDIPWTTRLRLLLGPTKLHGDTP